jgi:hypothetical protein
MTKELLISISGFDFKIWVSKMLSDVNVWPINRLYGDVMAMYNWVLTQVLVCVPGNGHRPQLTNV